MLQQPTPPGLDPHEIDDVFSDVASNALRDFLLRSGDRLRPLLVTRRYPAGATITDFDTEEEGLFLIASGEISRVRRVAGARALPLEVRRRGTFFGGWELVMAVARSSGGTPGVLDRWLSAMQPNADGKLRPLITEVARAVTDVVVLLLPRDKNAAVLQLLSASVGGTFQGLVLFALRRMELLSALRESIAFHRTGMRTLLRVLDLVQLASVQAGATVVEEGKPATGVYVVLEGGLEARRTSTSEQQHDVVDVPSRYSVFGDIATSTHAPEPYTVVATTAAVLAKVEVEDYAQLLRTSAALRRGVGYASFCSFDLLPEVLLMQSDLPAAPLRLLTEMLADTIAAEHGDPVLVLHFGAPQEVAGDEPPALPEAVPGTAAHASPAIPSGPEGVERVLRIIEAAKGRFEYVFLDPFQRPSDFLELVGARRIDATRAPRMPLVTRVIHLARDLLRPLPTRSLHGRQVLPCALLPMTPGARRGVADPFETVRLRLDLDRLGSLPPEARRPAKLDAATARQMKRWARAVTERRVGVALGGGGAWGFAHLALLTALDKAEVPLDMVSGSSFGALAGAYYCVSGQKGADQLVARGHEFDSLWRRVLYPVSSWFLGNLVDQHLGSALLEELEVPLYPVSTDVSTGTEYVPATGTVGSGVRASGAMPPMFTPVVELNGIRCIDGGFINNVPASAVIMRGADLVIASNIVAPPTVDRARPRTPFAAFLSALDPLARARDIGRAALILFHYAGESTSLLADVIVDSVFTGPEFWDFSQGRRVVGLARANAESCAVEIQARWQAMAQSRTAGSNGLPCSIRPTTPSLPSLPSPPSMAGR